MDNNNMDEDDAEELGSDFFDTPILTRSGESLVDVVQRERHRLATQVAKSTSEN